jgi:hypothetical protein
MPTKPVTTKFDRRLSIPITSAMQTDWIRSPQLDQAKAEVVRVALRGKP